MTILAFILTYPVALLGTAMIGLGSILRFVRGYRAALGPLPTVLVAVTMLALPLDSVLHELDDRLQRSAREEIVRRMESGELTPPRWVSVPPGRLVEGPQRGNLLIPVPLEYSAAVSNIGGHNLLQATFDPALTRAVFSPHPGIGNPLWAVVYDHDDKAPDPGDPGLGWWRIQRVERLRANWYRVVAEDPLVMR